MPTSTSAVTAWLSLPDDADDALVDVCVASANELVAGLDWVAAYAATHTPDTPDVPAVWPARADQGATMLAARLYTRRNSPAGVESFTDSIVYVARQDPAVDQLLRVGRYARPAVG